MPRPVTIADEAILDAARAVFLERGIRATTAEIARRAGISTGTIFQRYGSKEELFRTAMAEQRDLESALSIADRVGKGDVEQTLVKLGLFLADKFVDLLPKWMMAWANARGDKPGADNRPGLVSGQRALIRYLEGEMKLGRVREHDPKVVAATFSGAIFMYALTRVTVDAAHGLSLPRDAFVRGLCAALWQGIAPESARPKSGRKAAGTRGAKRSKR